MSKKNSSISKSEYYTNLMLITVLEALLLLIFQLSVFNASSVVSMYSPIWKIILPSLFIVSIVLAVVFIVLSTVKKEKKNSFLPAAKFFIYFALMLSIMRYIPNEASVAYKGRFYVNFQRGQKIAGIASFLYIAASFAYYSIISFKAEHSGKSKH